VVDPTSIPPGSVFYFVRNILCDEELRTPLVRKQELLATKFASLSSMSAGDGELFYKVYGNSPKNEENQIVVIARYNKSTNLKEIPLFAISMQLPILELQRHSLRWIARKNVRLLAK